MSSHVEQRFMEWMLRDNARPGTTINELDLARRFGIAVTGDHKWVARLRRGQVSLQSIERAEALMAEADAAPQLGASAGAPAPAEVG